MKSHDYAIISAMIFALAITFIIVMVWMVSSDHYAIISAMIFASAITFIIVMVWMVSSDHYIDPQRVTNDRNRCRIAEYNIAREYINICSTTFRSIDDQSR